jgi:hypothetical protein
MIVSVSRAAGMAAMTWMLTGESNDLKCRLAVAAIAARYLANSILIGGSCASRAMLVLPATSFSSPKSLYPAASPRARRVE